MRRAIMGLIAAAAAGLCVKAAPAATVSISDGAGHLVSVVDNGPGDVTPDVGAMTVSVNNIPGWTIVVTTGLTKDVNGTAFSPAEDLGISATYNGTGSSTLSIAFSDTGFEFSGALDLDLSGSAKRGTGTYSAQLWGDGTNAIGALDSSANLNAGTLLAGLSGTGDVAGDATSLGQPYSLTEFVELQALSGTPTFSVDANMTAINTIAAPLPSAAWMGLGTLLGLGAIGFARKRAIAAVRV